MNFNTKRIFQHLFFWIGIFLFYIFSSDTPELFGQYIETTLFRFPLLIIAAYVFNYWQVPYFLEQKKYVAFTFSMATIVVILVLIYRVIGYFYLDKYCANGPYPLISFTDFPFYMLSFHFPALIMYFYKSNKKQESEKNQINLLEKEKLETELKYLKAQLNPHFLFNTLNNLYSYIITKSPKAPEMVLQLSEILDYILYKSQHAFVTLIEEVRTIENYIALQKIKYGDRLVLTVDKNISNESEKISPLILLSILENAFKHGVSGSIIKPEIQITIFQDNSTIKFSVWNTKITDKKDNLTDDDKDGIGLANIQRQLDLIYPKKHQLNKDESENYFNLELILNTA